MQVKYSTLKSRKQYRSEALSVLTSKYSYSRTGTLPEFVYGTFLKNNIKKNTGTTASQNYQI